MATTSYLYHSLGLRGYVHRCTEYLNGWIYHHIEQAPHQRTCRNCGARWNELRMDSNSTGEPSRRLTRPLNSSMSARC